MPTCDPSCPTINSSIYSYTQAYKTAGNPNELFASMGWMGFAILNLDQFNGRRQLLRLRNSSLNLRQEISSPDVIDGRIDKTIYAVGPKIVEGDLTFPLIADVDPANLGTGCPTEAELQSASQSSLLDAVWCWATARGPSGRMAYDQASLDVRYTNHAAFRFDRCMANRFSMTVAEQRDIECTVGMIARTRNRYETPETAPGMSAFLSPARILRWNDISINGYKGCTGATTPLFYSNQIREFTMEINNNAERYYTLNGDLAPTDINVRKREINGTLRLMGLNGELSRLAETNQNRFTEKNYIDMAIYIGNSTFDENTGVFRTRTGVPIWNKQITSVVFNIEELAMTNDLFETTVRWIALANDQTNWEAFDPATSCYFPPW